MSYRKYLMTDDVPPSELYKTVKIDTDSDTISRQAAIDELVKMLGYCFQADEEVLDAVVTTVRELPSAQPDIIYCKDCVKHNKGLGNYEVHPDGSGTWIWKDSACPLVSWRDKAQGHEFDYQFCAYAEKREVTT